MPVRILCSWSSSSSVAKSSTSRSSGSTGGLRALWDCLGPRNLPPSPFNAYVSTLAGLAAQWVAPHGAAGGWAGRARRRRAGRAAVPGCVLLRPLPLRRLAPGAARARSIVGSGSRGPPSSATLFVSTACPLGSRRRGKSGRISRISAVDCRCTSCTSCQHGGTAVSAQLSRPQSNPA